MNFRAATLQNLKYPVFDKKIKGVWKDKENRKVWPYTDKKQSIETVHEEALVFPLNPSYKDVQRSKENNV